LACCGCRPAKSYTPQYSHSCLQSGTVGTNRQSKSIKRASLFAEIGLRVISLNTGRRMHVRT
jgi:hypothetical protein